MTSFVALILVLSVTSSAVFTLPSGERNSTSGKDAQKKLDSNKAGTEAPKGAMDYIEAANARLAHSKGGPGRITNGDIATPSKRNASPSTAQGVTWPKSRGYVYIPVEISSKYSSAERNVLVKSLVEFHKVSCIRFVWRGSQQDYLSFIPFKGCSSYIGRQGGGQRISIQQQGCVHRGVIQHEILHSLGFNHEQARSDRDDHVHIMTKNIKPGNLNNFNKVKTNNLGTPYDYNSIMHYSRYAFSKQNGLPTIVPVPNCKADIGKGTKMSSNDIKRLNKLYKCRGY